MMAEGSSSPVEFLATFLGTTEPALRLLISLLAAYVIVLFHKSKLHDNTPTLQHLYFIACGIGLGYYNYGCSIIHSVSCVLVLYLTLVSCGGTLFSVIFSFVFHMGYLLAGYYYTGTDGYDIKWSMPHCVLTMKLVGIAYDVYDGQKDLDKLSDDQKKTALKENPSLLELAGHSFFPGSFLVGPQFSMRRYQDFIQGMFTDKDEGNPSSISAGFFRGGLGAFYLSVYQVGSLLLPDTYILGDEFQELGLWKRFLLVGIWGKVVLYKYVSCWLLAEGVCIISGVAYNGKDDRGRTRWNGCENVKLDTFEQSIKFAHIIASFNTNTNAWVAQYVYKRLKFLGNRYISQAAALLFLAVWHGLHSGYYMCFFMEFIVMKFERDMEAILQDHPFMRPLKNSLVGGMVKWVAMKLHLLVFFGYCIVPFALLSFSRWWHVYSSLYFSGFFIYGGWPLYSPLVRKFFRITASINKNGKKAQ